MAVHGGKLKIRHKNMADSVAKNDGCHGGKKKHIYKLIEIEKNKGLHSNKLKKFHEFIQ